MNPLIFGHKKARKKSRTDEGNQRSLIKMSKRRHARRHKDRERIEWMPKTFPARKTTTVVKYKFIKY